MVENQRVVEPTATIAIIATKEQDINAEISVDGHSLGEFEPEDLLSVRAADSRITFLHPPGYDYFEILRTKLYWGRDNRNRGDRARKV